MPIPISNVTRRVVYAASGTGPYAFTFEILANTDIAVFRDDTLLTLTTDYTVTIAANGTGSITLVATPTGATQIAIVGNRTIQRTTDFVTGGDFFANTVNDEMDQQTIFAQQNAEGLQRALSAPQTDPTTINMTLPRASVRASKVLSFDATGNPAATEFIGSNRGNWASGTLYYVRDIIKDTTNSNIWQVITQHTSSGSLPIGTNADAAKFTLLVDAAAAGTSATAAAASASAAATSASNASTSATNAASSASTASTQASNASTSATNAANSASAASSSASTASTAATNASNSATSASTSASNASSSASAASTSESNASTSATNAANSASTATTQATNASTSAGTATTQATNAASSATAAAASAAAAAASFDAFDDIYLGAKTSNPTLDNDGNALTTGDQYFNTVANELRVWNGSTWQTASTVGGTVTSINVTGLATLATGAILNTPTSATLTNATGLPLTTGVTGTLPTANGGTNLTSFTANGVVYASSSSALATGSALVFNGTNLSVGTTALSSGKFSTLADLTAVNGLVVRDSATTYANNDNFVLLQNSAGATAGSLTHPAASSLGVWGNDDIRFLQGSGATEQMRLTSTGLGIGTSSPAAILAVTKSSATAAVGLLLRNPDGTVGSSISLDFETSTGTSGSEIALAARIAAVRTAAGTTGALDFYTNTVGVLGSAKMRLDGSGNLGLGVTPNTSWTDFTVFQNKQAAILGYDGQTHYTQNAYYQSSTWKYIASSLNATRYMHASGIHSWHTASTGTAGNAITFTQAATLDANGDFLVGKTTSDGRLTVKGSTSNGSTYTAYMTNSSNTELFAVRTDGLVETGLAANSPYNLTTATAANVHIDSQGWMYRSTSSLKYKTDVQDATHGLEKVMALRPVTYKGKNDGDTVFGGLIAEEVHEAGLTEFVQYAEDGTPDALAYGQMVSLAFKAIQELKAEFDAYKASHP